MNRAVVLAALLWTAFAVSFLVGQVEGEPPRKDLSLLPMDLFGPEWTGVNEPLDEAVIKKAGVSSYVQRVYSNGKRTVWFYVGYVRGYSPESIHYPEVCFPASGREREGKQDVELVVPGLSQPARLRELYWRTPNGRLYTLNGVYFNGRFTAEPEHLRWASLWEGIRYFSILILSGDVAGTPEATREAYSDMLRRALPPLVEHFPS